MENKVQVEKLKLNVTNIKSTLISSNKRLRKIQIRKDQLVLKLTKDQTRRKAEGSVEEKNIKGAGIFGRVIGRIAAPVMNLWDRVLNFFGAILLGFILTKLPEIIKTLEPVLKVVKPIFVGTLKAIGFITEKMIDFVGFLSDFQESFNPSESQKNLKESEKRLNEIVGDKLESADSDRNERISRSEEIDSKLFDQNVESSQAKITPTPSSNPSLTGEIQKRNMGGVVNKPQDANLPPQSSSFGNVDNKNPFKRFYAASNKNLKNALLLSAVNENFKKLFKEVKFLIPESKGGSDSPPSTTPSRTLIGGDSLAAVLPQGAPQFTSPFGERNGRQHRGIDIGVDGGSPVIASQSGEVVDIYPNFGNHGDAVVVKYNDGFKGVYGHIDPSVSIGTKVDRGNVLGTVKYWPNGYGNADNTHLHYERVNPSGVHIDPSPYITGLKSGTGGIMPITKTRNLSGGQSDTDMTIAILPMYQRVDNYVNSNTPQMSGGSSSGIENLIAFTGKRVNLQTFRLG